MFREPPLRSGSLFPPRHTSAPLSAALSAAPPPEAKPMPKGGHFRHPGRWWQPCVTPYFADLGVGDMRGQPSRQYTSPPRRRWQAVSPRHSIPHPLGRPSPPIVYPSPLSLLRSPPRCKAAQALPSGHTHLESPCRPSRRSKQAQFPSSNSRCTTGRSATPAPPPRRRRRPTADISATPAGEAAVRSPCRGALRRFCYRLSWWRRGCS